MNDQLVNILRGKRVTRSEKDVIAALMKGMTNKEIAIKKFVTEKTVKFHLSNIYKKFNVKNRSQLIVFFANYGYITHTPGKVKTISEIFGER